MTARATDSGQAAARARARMIERLRGQGIRDERVLAAMLQIPRHLFVEEGLAYSAYDDTALPIGFQQTIGEDEALRTGTYAKTLTFTLSTTNP